MHKVDAITLNTAQLQYMVRYLVVFKSIMQYNIKPYAFALMQRMNAFLRAEACTVEVYRWSQNYALWCLLLFVFCSCRNGIKVCSSSISLNLIIRIFPTICFQSGRWWGQRSRLREGSSKPPTHCHFMTQSRTSQPSPQPDSLLGPPE